MLPLLQFLRAMFSLRMLMAAEASPKDFMAGEVPGEDSMGVEDSAKYFATLRSSNGSFLRLVKPIPHRLI